MPSHDLIKDPSSKLSRRTHLALDTGRKVSVGWQAADVRTVLDAVENFLSARAVIHDFALFASTLYGHFRIARTYIVGGGLPGGRARGICADPGRQGWKLRSCAARRIPTFCARPSQDAISRLRVINVALLDGVVGDDHAVRGAVSDRQRRGCRPARLRGALEGPRPARGAARLPAPGGDGARAHGRFALPERGRWGNFLVRV